MTLSLEKSMEEGCGKKNKRGIHSVCGCAEICKQGHCELAAALYPFIHRHSTLNQI
eukprot:m.145813 g.145813  ORF g.145813 m.145813 type:complete len:56 (-) comp14958_c0_seq2:1507-1674(-)